MDGAKGIWGGKYKSGSSSCIYTHNTAVRYTIKGDKCADAQGRSRGTGSQVINYYKSRSDDYHQDVCTTSARTFASCAGHRSTKRDAKDYE